jgi:hypothetical protein
MVAQDPGAASAPLLDHRQLQIAMARIATEHPELVSILPVGTSRGNRKIDALRLSAGERAPGRPAILLVANIDGPAAWTASIALSHAQKLAANYASDAKTKALLDTTTLYIVPRAAPDAAEARFVEPLHEAQASGRGIDNDRDGRFGEDGPSDVNEDGLVLVLRVLDPEGEWLEDPADARALVRADRAKGQHGRFKRWVEGRDSDKDELVGEDSEFDAVVNRNFAARWVEHDPASGLFATDEPEVRALCDFILAHKDIALVVTYGMQDNLVEKPKSVADDAPNVKLIPPVGVQQSDADLYAEIGQRYKRITKSSAKGRDESEGSFQTWIQMHRGLWSLNLALWSMPLDESGKPVDAAAKPADSETKSDKDADASKKDDSKKDDDKPKPSDDAKRLRWMDANAGESARFVPWKPFDHPELGAVEIGGFAPFATIEPPESERARIAAVELEFLVSLGDLLPRVKVAKCTAKEVSAGLWKIEATITNDSFLPYASAAGRRAETVRPVRVTLRAPKNVQLLAGTRQQLVQNIESSGGRKELTWLVLGGPPSTLSIEVDTDNAGTLQVVPEVK